MESFEGGECDSGRGVAVVDDPVDAVDDKAEETALLLFAIL